MRPGDVTRAVRTVLVVASALAAYAALAWLLATEPTDDEGPRGRTATPTASRPSHWT
ncbi:hypothetical protein AB0O07_26125 [Streptomyces sp. NPDC093085]|uniref:hypothetical protein n=1 Tax=Streptomyces sp. NPDC093085 TaxID=3155068 RepID=UPI003443B938